jgi:hypothetical protein
MSSIYNARSRGEMTDAQLDAVLETANKELLDHIQATADSYGALLTITAPSAHEGPTSEIAVPASGDLLGQSPVAEMISMRIRARELADALADPLHVRILELDRALALAHVLARDLDLIGELDPENKLTLARARRLARDLASALARARPLCFSNYHYLARKLARNLDMQQVDASNADLSGMEIRNLDALDGIIWTRQTAWPPNIADQVRAHSDEVRPDVYQICLGTHQTAML